MDSRLKLLKWYRDIGCDIFYENEPQIRIESKESKESKSYEREIKKGESLEHTLKPKEAQLSSPTASKLYTSFEELISAIKEFDGCDLKKTAINTVIYDGIPDSKIMLIGEAPGATEDKEGIPFCGQSGKLLDNIMASVGLDRKKNAFITNTVFWRPPANRRPTPEEIDICRPFLEQIIAFLSPKLILLVGSTAVESLLRLKLPMNSLRQQTFSYNNQYLKQEINAEVIFHPSYLLRQPLQKKLMWHDMLRIKQKYL